jgi:hypothetical protein
MPRTSAEYRNMAQRVRAVADTIGRFDLRRAAHEIADGWDRMADEAEVESSPKPSLEPEDP